MATFNRAHLIAESIDSILNQTRPPDEFIVVNDGSTDRTADVVQRYGDRIRYVEKPNGGKPAAINLVLPAVESTFVWIFDDDDVALPGALDTHLKFLSTNPAYDFSYGTNYVFSGEFSERALEHGKLKTFPQVSSADYLLWIAQSPFLTSLIPGMLIPTRCYRTVGGFDEALQRGEDVDMLLRLARKFRAGYVGQPTFAERLHSGERGPAFERHADADRYRVFRRYMRPIFEKLRASLSLAEYLPKRAGMATEDRDLGPVETRLALLQRGVIMAIHGLYPEALDDFRNYSAYVDAATVLTNDERRQLSTLAYALDADALPPNAYYRQLGALSRHHPQLFRAAARGLYWSVAREVRQRRLRATTNLLRRAASLASHYLVAPTRRPVASR